VALACFISPGKDLPSAVERVRFAEKAGYEAVFATTTTGRDGLMTSAAYAAATSTIKVGTGVLPCLPRHPLSLSIEAATLDEFSGGRLILGIGPSHKISMETFYGIPMERVLPRMKEYVAILRSVFTTNAVSFDGEFYHAQWAFINYGARASLPIYIAALAPGMLRFCGAACDGDVLWGCLPTYIRETVTPTIHGAATEAGRSPSDVQIVAAVPTALTTNREAAYAAFRPEFFVYMNLPFYRRAIAGAGYEGELKAFDDAQAAGDFAGQMSAMSDRMLDEFLAVGDELRIADKVAEYRDAGVTLPGIGVFNAGDGYAGHEATLETTMRVAG
jgi:alkanesulfonate monooxygenase SsuD/methylene tetrahydromethanopterin reductase-like flavin-dependent oxidoreductase (luciferase family)